MFFKNHTVICFCLFLFVARSTCYQQSLPR